LDSLSEESAMSTATRLRRNDIGPAEAALRVELAACYRIFDMLGWTELIFNHITVKVPGPEEHFLINPYGLWYSEVTASNLVKLDLDGNIVGDSAWPANKAGYIIHSAIHRARADVHCIMHTHTTTGVAVACLKEGLSQTNFYSAMLHDEIAYHDFEGLTTRPDECDRLVGSLGARNAMILRNHGLLACGGSIPEAFNRLWRMQRACDVQVLAAAMGGSVIPVPEAAARYSTAMVNACDPNDSTDQRVFAALQRRLDARDRSYRD
jgi:ribulose-5-phosphate 4-epimerase/fuculose-1-phosphate aldolase